MSRGSLRMWQRTVGGRTPELLDVQSARQVGPADLANEVRIAAHDELIASSRQSDVVPLT